MTNNDTCDNLSTMTGGIEKAFDVERLPFRRQMTQEEIEKLQGAIKLAFSRDIDKKILEKIADYCFYVERNIEGRASGSIEDLVLRYLSRYFSSLGMAADQDNVCHLEIGVLFGATTILSCHAVQLAEKKAGIVVIDPFKGYYDNEVDPLTKLPVTEDRFRANLARFSFDDANVAVYRGLSTDREIIEKCGKYRILSLVIDGDHSYEGVKKDWINYSGLVVEGGYVLIDDYNCRYWPEVTRFVNGEILSHFADNWEPVLVFGNTIILKRLKSGGAENNRLEELVYKLKDAERIIESRNREIEYKSREIENILNSISWKITKPLRWLRDKYRSL